MNKTLLVIFITAIVIGGGSFYGGMKYAQNKASRGLTQKDFQNLRNLSPEERQQRLQQSGDSRTESYNGGFGNRTGGGFMSGKIISKDDKSITIKLRDGGSKIVFYSDNTEVGKFVNGIPNDLEIGKTISVNGKTNQDGSITAQSIQIRSDLPIQP